MGRMERYNVFITLGIILCVILAIFPFFSLFSLFKAYKSGSAPQVQTMLEDLKSEDLMVRRQAAADLGVFGKDSKKAIKLKGILKLRKYSMKYIKRKGYEYIFEVDISLFIIPKEIRYVRR